MLFNQSELDEGIRNLQTLLLEKQIAFDKAMKQDVEFAELKKLYEQIKKVNIKLSLWIQESNAQKQYMGNANNA